MKWETVPSDLATERTQFLCEFPKLKQWKMKRYITCHDSVEIQLQDFSVALAMHTVVQYS